mmetsp:Transcript_8133/g.22638  ORF Transcript_8133/g.22638 Transcript_8133/m.22638 type:complete len:240 (-) Transcript_8133:483-1202(-)
MNAKVSCLLPSTVWWKLSAICHMLSDLACSVSARQSKKWCFLDSNARLTWPAMAVRNLCSTPSGLNVCQSWFALPTSWYGRPVFFIALSTCATSASRSVLYRFRLASNSRSLPSLADQSAGAPGAPHPRWLPTHQCITSTTTTTGLFLPASPCSCFPSFTLRSVGTNASKLRTAALTRGPVITGNPSISRPYSTSFKSCLLCGSGSNRCTNPSAGPYGDVGWHAAAISFSFSCQHGASS